MKQEGKKEQLINWILAGGFVAAMMLIIGSLFDYYYDLNDEGYSGRSIYRHAGRP